MIPDSIVLHHSACQDGTGLEWAGIRRYQTSYRIDRKIVSEDEWRRRKAAGEPGFFELPWLDIGYHAGIEQISGGFETLIGRPWDKPGAHCPGYNARSLGLCFVGNFADTPPPLAQLEQGAKLLAFWLRRHAIPMGNIHLHRELNNTDCPGEAFAKVAFPQLLRLIEFY